MQVLTAVDEERIRRLVAADEFFWIDVESRPDEELDQLSTLLQLHPAAVEDSHEWDQLPKVDDYGDHLLIVFFTAELTPAAVPREVHVYLSGGWVVTIHRCPALFDRVRNRLAAEDPAHEDLIVYLLLDAMADGWDPVVDSLDQRVDMVEAAVLERPRQSQLTTIYRLKQEVGDLLRHAARQAAMLPEGLERVHALPGLTRGSREWLRDVAGHTDSIASDLRRLTNDLSALTDTFFNANANRLNRLATLVAVGSLFFLIWTLVTGFFGQNFGYLVRHISSAHAFWGYELGALVVPTIVLAAVLIWKRRDWWS